MKAQREENYERIRESERRSRAKRKAENPTFDRDYQRRVYRANREKFRRAQWRRKGMPEPTRSMPELCECCEKAAPSRMNPHSGFVYSTLHLDHHHVTNQFRGWLCHNCNLALGRLGDSIDGVTKLLSYLQRAERVLQ